MKTPRITHAVGHIDDDLINGAANASKTVKKKSWIKWGSIAACLAIFVMVGALIIPMLFGGNPTNIGGIDRNYNGVISGTEGDIDFPWEYKLIYEKFPTIKYNGNEYRTRARAIGENLLGDVLGTCTAKGVDNYRDNSKTYTETFDVRKIKGVSEERLVAVGMDGSYYVYFNNTEKQIATFGELLDVYNLSETLPLSKFSVNEGYKEKGDYQISDDAYIWQILSECRDAEAYSGADKWNRGDRNYLSFTATSEALGVYKKVFYVTEDGYIATNVFNYQYVYFIGVDKANSIITYAKTNSTETEPEQYEYTIAGTITEIGDGYILIDDTVLCKDKNDGMVFKILTEDLQIRRYVECGNFKVGDTVAVKFQTEIVLGENNTVSGAISMYKGKVIDSGMEVPE